MKKIIAQSPTRVDLAGGTLDLYPLYLFHKNCVTVNLAIDIYTRATITPRKDKKIILSSKDTGDTKEYKNMEELKSDTSDDLKLLRVHAEFWNPTKGFELITESESPIGGGIAGSSSLGISLSGAFSKFTGKKFDKHQMAQIAGNLEAMLMMKPAGCQDYFPALFGGLSLVELGAEGPKRRDVPINLKKFSEHFTLVYTGKPHHSGLNNWQILKGHVDGDQKMFHSIAKVRDVAIDMRVAVVKKEFKKFGPIFNREFEARVELSPVFTSPEIDRLKSIAMSAGAEAVKICGAGGGGCVFLWSEPSKKRILEEECARGGFQVLRAKPTEHGLEVKISSKS